MTTKRTRQLGIALAATLGLGLTISGTASAQRYGDRYDKPREARMRLYDRDRDGRLDRREREVMEHDRNGDGVLSRNERAVLEVHLWNLTDDDVFYDRGNDNRDLISFRFKESAKRFARFDYNRDGLLSWREVRGSWVGKHFRDIDRDGDRAISPRELDRSFRRTGRRAQARYNPGVIRGQGYRYEYRLEVGV